MSSYELTKSEIQALGLHEKIKDQEVLHSLAEIAAYLRCSITTVRKAIKNRGLPANPDFMGKYLTTKTLIDKWISEAHLAAVEQHGWDTRPNHGEG